MIGNEIARRTSFIHRAANLRDIIGLLWRYAPYTFRNRLDLLSVVLLFGDIGCRRAAARNFLNALERIPSIIDQYKAKNEVLEKEVPQLQEIAGKVWKKEEELKQLKSELAALDRKIQLELAPPTPEVAEKENEGQQVKPEAEDVRNRQAQYSENAPPQISNPSESIIPNHTITGHPGLYAKEETRFKGLKI